MECGRREGGCATMVEERKYIEENLELEQVEMEEHIDIDEDILEELSHSQNDASRVVDSTAEMIEREQGTVLQYAEGIYGTGKDIKHAVKQLTDYEIDPEAIDLDNRVADGKNLANNAVNAFESKWQEISWENEENTIDMEADEEVEEVEV